MNDRRPSRPEHDLLLLVGMGLLGHGYIPAAHRLGLAVALVERQEFLDQVREEIDVAHLCAGAADQYWLPAALTAAESHRPGAVIPYAEPQVVAAAWVNERYGLPGASLGAAIASRDKGLQRALLTRASVAQPEFLLAQTIDEARAFAAAREGVMVKALHSSGSRGVSLAQTDEELAQRFSAASPGEALVIEEYLEGPEYSAEALIRDGRVVFRNYTEKLTTGPPEFVEIGHIVPAALSPEEEALADQALDAIVTGLGVGTSLMHAEFRIADGVPHFIETALRTPGDHIMWLIELAYGFDFFGAVVEITARLPRQAFLPATGTSAIRYLEVRPGTVRHVKGAAEARALPGVEHLELPYEGGQPLGKIRMSRDRGGFVIVRADTRTELNERISGVLDTVEVSTD